MNRDLVAPLQASLGRVIPGKADVIQQLTMALVDGGHEPMEDVNTLTPNGTEAVP